MFPSTSKEIIETNAPHIYFRQQLIATEKWPNDSCKKCFGIGYYGALNKNPVKVPKIGANKPCPCGSVDVNGNRKKFKRCCSERLEDYKRSQSIIILCPCIGKGKPIVESNPQVTEKILSDIKEKSV